MPLNNNRGINYVTRSYEQIKSAVLTKFQANVPEITDHTESNPWVKLLGIWSALIEMIGYYVERRAEEVYISTAKRFESGIKIASQFDYRVKGTLSASVDLTFSIASPIATDIDIPADTSVQTPEGVVFLTTLLGTIQSGSTQVIIPSTQIKKVAPVAIGNSNGSVNQKYSLEPNVVDQSVQISVGADAFLVQETFAYSFATDKHFLSGLNESGEMELRFGDSINGEIPGSGLNILADYSVSEGVSGNVGAGTINQINSTVPVPSGVNLQVNNVLAASGGADQENLQDLKKNIPLSIRTKDRAVTDQDYIDIAELASGVSKAGLLFECANTIDIYIAPDGGGIASSGLLASTKDYVQRRSIVGREIRVLPAGEVLLKFTINVFVLDTSLRTSVVQSVKDNIVSSLSVEFQKIGGSVQLGDIYEVIENTIGVNYSEILIMTTVPFASPINHTTALDWSRETQPESEDNNVWKITIINATSYDLIKNNSYVGTFEIGELVNQVDIEFTVNSGAYSLGEAWNFYTYRYNGSINLLEQSIPVTSDSDITINAFGGVG